VIKPGNDVLNTSDELLEKIEETAKKTGAKLKRKIERRDETVEGVLARAEDPERERSGSRLGVKQGKGTATNTLVMLGMVSMQWSPPVTFTACDCNNQSNLVETYSLLEPDVYSASGGNGEVVQLTTCMQIV
jgi:hypothetical protein